MSCQKAVAACTVATDVVTLAVSINFAAAGYQNKPEHCFVDLKVVVLVGFVVVVACLLSFLLEQPEKSTFID